MGSKATEGNTDENPAVVNPDDVEYYQREHVVVSYSDCDISKIPAYDISKTLANPPWKVYNMIIQHHFVGCTGTILFTFPESDPCPPKEKLGELLKDIHFNGTVSIRKGLDTLWIKPFRRK
jgi:hypothetical protein